MLIPATKFKGYCNFYFQRITPPYSTCVHNTHVVYKKGYIMCSKRARKTQAIPETAVLLANG